MRVGMFGAMAAGVVVRMLMGMIAHGGMGVRVVTLVLCATSKIAPPCPDQADAHNYHEQTGDNLQHVRYDELAGKEGQ